MNECQKCLNYFEHYVWPHHIRDALRMFLFVCLFSNCYEY